MAEFSAEAGRVGDFGLKRVGGRFTRVVGMDGGLVVAMLRGRRGVGWVMRLWEGRESGLVTLGVGFDTIG